MEIIEITRSKLRKALLKHFFLHPGKRFYLRELERILGQPAANIRREFKNLKRLDLFSSQKVGNLVFYSLNKRSPFYNEIRNLVLKTAGLGDVIKENLIDLEGIDFAFVYGSFAKGEEIATSDIDLMVIGNVKRKELSPRIFKIEKALGRTVNLLTYSKKEILHRIKKGNTFIINVLKGKKIMILGEEDALQRIGK